MENLPIDLGKLRKLREVQAISQEYMAGQLGVSRPTYVQIEKGEKEPTVTQMAKLLEIFGPGVASAEAKKRPVINKDIYTPKTDMEKFKQVLLYILEKVGAKPNIGETAIYKLLYFIDFDYYEKFGKPFMGATYIKNHFGPTPKQMKLVFEQMITQGWLEQVKSKYFQHEQKKYLPLQKTNLSALSASEIQHVDEVLARLSDKNGSELSFYSHQDVPWQATEDQQAIDYNLVFQRTAPYAHRDYEGLMIQTAAEDALKELGGMSGEEYRYYQNL